jgi:hypothetical protein
MYKAFLMIHDFYDALALLFSSLLFFVAPSLCLPLLPLGPLFNLSSLASITIQRITTIYTTIPGLLLSLPITTYYYYHISRFGSWLPRGIGC